MDKKTLIIGLLCVLLLISGGYIIWDEFEKEKIRNLSMGYQQGYSYGVQETVYALLKQTDGCTPASINYGNYTREVIDTACLQRVTE